MLTLTDWRELSACRDTDPDLFFPVGTTGAAIDQIQAAKEVCEVEFVLVLKGFDRAKGGADLLIQIGLYPSVDWDAVRLPVLNDLDHTFP